MNLLNEKIRAIQQTISHLTMAIPLEIDGGKKQRMKESLKELNALLEEKLSQCEDFKG